jgi:hypothetical protein
MNIKLVTSQFLIDLVNWGISKLKFLLHRLAIIHGKEVVKTYVLDGDPVLHLSYNNSAPDTIFDKSCSNGKTELDIKGIERRLWEIAIDEK